jgi:putrescine transport system ATP-binding protein
MLELKDISKSYHQAQVLSNISGQFNSGMVNSVLGSSGVGKTTLLRIIAGLEKQDAGTVELDGLSVDSLPPEKRQIVYMSQQPLLFPHLNVLDNVAFGLRAKGLSNSASGDKAMELLQSVDMLDFAKKDTSSLSGGQQQRVAFLRAIAVEPKVLLLDEPFAALDAESRTIMQDLFCRVADEKSLTAIFVTHDLKEALRVGNRIGLLDKASLSILSDAEAFFRAFPQRLESEKKFWDQFKS